MQSNGNGEYFTQVYKKYQGYVATVLRNHIKSEPTVEDLTQEVFLAFWGYLKKDRFDRVKSITSFVSTLAHRKAIDYLRKTSGQKGHKSKKPKTILVDNFEWVKSIAPPSNPLELNLLKGKQRRLGKLVTNCIDYLQTEQKLKQTQCLIRYIGGKSDREIASELKIATGSVSAHISCMRQKLRKKFAKELQELYED